MRFESLGEPSSPAVLFFHAMGVTGASSEPVARHLADRYFCIMPTSTVYCEGRHYISRADEASQVEEFLQEQGVSRLAMVVASSIGADLACAFLSKTSLPVEHAFFDDGQFARIPAATRQVMTPFLWLVIKSLAWSNGGTLKHILWCDDETIKPYFVAAGHALTYGNLRRQMKDSLVDEPFVHFPPEMQHRMFWEFGSSEDHFKYRDAVMQTWPEGNFPVFEGHNHMQFQITNPAGFARMLEAIMETGHMPSLPFCR